MSQTTYSQYGAEALPGMKADIGFDDVISRACEEADGIPFGRVVVAGTDPEKQCKLPDAAADEVLGIAIRTMAVQPAILANDVGGYPDEAAVNVFKKGRVWVEAAEAVDRGDAVYAIVADGADKGKITDTVGSNVLVPTAKVLRTIAAPGLTMIEINLP